MQDIYCCVIEAQCIIASSPGPFPPLPRGEAWYTPLRMREIFRYIFRKKLRALPCPYAVDYTNQEYRAFYILATI